MVINIPNEKKKEWRGIFSGKNNGNLWASWNMDLERNPGNICLSGRLGILKASDTNLSFSIPLKFLKSNADGTSRYWAFVTNKLLRTSDSTPTGTWAADTISGSPTSGYDFIVHGDSDHSDTNASDRILHFLSTDIAILNKVVGTDTAPYTWDTDWWTAVDSNGGLGQTALKDVNHPVAKLQSLVGFCDGNRFHTLDKNDIPVYGRLTFPIGFSGNCVYASANRFWIGLIPDRGNNGMIVEWDGSSENYNKDYPIEGVPISGFIKDGIPYFINHFGQILEYNGENFVEVARFPAMEDNALFQNSAAINISVGISRYGCIVDNDIVKIFVATSSVSLRMRTGIWIFNTKTKNLYHSQSVGGYVTDSDGQPDFGHGTIEYPGGMFKTREYGGTIDFICGGSYVTNWSTGISQMAIFKSYPNKGTAHPSNRGYLITPYITASAIVNFWSSLWIKFKKFIHGDNKIIVKFRTSDPFVDSSGESKRCIITWITSTTFKGAIPTGVKIGYEIEILAGMNAGCCFNISALSGTPNGSTTITVTIDEARPYPAADTTSDTSTGLALFDNWNKSDIVTDTAIGNYNFALGGADSDGNQLNNGEEIQFKVELRGKSMEVDQLIAVTKKAIKPE